MNTETRATPIKLARVPLWMESFPSDGSTPRCSWILTGASNGFSNTFASVKASLRSKLPVIWALPPVIGSLIRGAEYNSDLLPKVRLEVLVDEGALGAVMAAIEEGGRTGRFGDGKIWIIEVRDAVRVRTGERGASAIA